MRDYLTFLRAGAILGATVILILIPGCGQKLLYREYHIPTADTAVKGDDGLTRGAVSKEVFKDGAPDWSSGDNKFNANVSFIGIK